MTGIVERRHAAAEIATSDLAVAAAEACIASADIDRSEIDLVLVGTYTPDFLMPATANLVQHRLGLCAPAMDIQAACTSFVYALLCGAQAVIAGSSRLALVIGADVNTRIVDANDEKSVPVFGDGAGAVLLARGDADQGILGYAAGSDGGGATMLYRPMGGTREPFSRASDSAGREMLSMDGPRVFKWAVRTLFQSVAEALSFAGVTLAEIQLAVFHQANLRILEAAAKQLGLDRAKLVTNVERYGNTASGSIPLALDEAVRGGRVQRGDLLLIGGFGGGLSWGTMVLRW